MRAAAEIQQITLALGPVNFEAHHIGSTAVPGLAAKPVLDLMLIAENISQIDDSVGIIEKLGYLGWGELGIAGRRYFTKESESGARLAQLHCFAQGSPHIERHLAFRDYLRAHPSIASAYASEKQRCANLHPKDSHKYSDCKADWIIRVESDALFGFRGLISS